MLKQIQLLFIGLLLCQTTLNAQKLKDNPKIVKVENGLLESRGIVFADSIVAKFRITERMKFYNVPSVSIAVINKGKLEWAKAYGLADINLHRKANTNTLYQAASISKSLNGLCIVKLVQDGKLSLDKDIREYLKTWTFPDNEFSKNKTITLRNLLSHTAGLNLAAFDGYKFDDKIPKINEILNGVSPANNEAIKPIKEPNNKDWDYSGGGIVISKKIIDDNITSNYDSLMKNLVLNPLGMTNSCYSQPLNKSQNNFAVAYQDSLKEVRGKYHIYPELAPDGLWTTPKDLSKFILSIQQSLKGNSKSLLTKSMANEMLTPVLSKTNSALSFFINELDGQKYFSHSGGNSGYKTIYFGGFTSGTGVIIMTNSDNGQILGEIINSIATVYNWKGFYNPKVVKLVAVSDTLLAKYVGTYEVTKTSFIYVTIENNKLVTQNSGVENPKSILYPESQNLFYSELNGYQHFERNKLQEFDTLVFKNDGQDIKAKKIYPSWGIVGSATDNGWDGPDIKLIETRTKGIWEIKNVKLKEGEIKFRFNNDWTLNLGQRDNVTKWGDGENIKIESGTYNIVIELTNFDSPKYTISKIN